MDVTRIPKIELHLHLDGAVPPETMWRMAQEKHVSLPVDTLDEFYAWLVKTADCRDVNTYLARFELPLQLMHKACNFDSKSITVSDHQCKTCKDHHTGWKDTTNQCEDQNYKHTVQCFHISHIGIDPCKINRCKNKFQQRQQIYFILCI